jgi:hypothetical protein
MATNLEGKEFTFADECDNAFAAHEEITRTGNTARRCLRCGAHFVFNKTQSSFQVHCETEGCFRETVRGI